MTSEGLGIATPSNTEHHIGLLLRQPAIVSRGSEPPSHRERLCGEFNSLAKMVRIHHEAGEWRIDPTTVESDHTYAHGAE